MNLNLIKEFIKWLLGATAPHYRCKTHKRVFREEFDANFHSTLFGDTCEWERIDTK